MVFALFSINFARLCAVWRLKIASDIPDIYRRVIYFVSSDSHSSLSLRVACHRVNPMAKFSIAIFIRSVFSSSCQGSSSNNIRMSAMLCEGAEYSTVSECQSHLAHSPICTEFKNIADDRAIQVATKRHRNLRHSKEFSQ